MTDLIVDANSVYARAWYAAKENPDKAVDAAVNVVMMLFNPERIGEKVDRSMFCWDGGQKKDKGREARPESYEPTKALVMESVAYLFGTTNVRIDGYEADDVIATAALRSTADHVIVASADKDLHQLNSTKISIFDINARGMVSKREIMSKWGVKRPSQVSIALAIQGDSADKITGIRGWGPKKVKMLFEAVTPEMEFDAALQAIMDQIPEDRMGEFEESLVLTLLDPDVPGVPDPSALKLVSPHEVAQKFSDYYLNVYKQYRHPSLGARERED